MNSKAEFLKIEPNVYVLQSTFVNSKRGLIVDDTGSTIIDTSVSFSETEMMIDKANNVGKPVRRVILTHSHFDHSAGSQILQDVERIAYNGASENMLSKHTKEYLAMRPAEHPDLENVRITLPTIEIDGEAIIRLAGRELLLFSTPGHSPDSMSILIEPDGILFTGDAVITCFPPVIQNGSCQEAIKTTKFILGMDFSWLVPGHGPVLAMSDAHQHCKISLEYLVQMRETLLTIEDPETPMKILQAAVEDLPGIFPQEIEMVEVWHQRALTKIWEEQWLSLNAKRDP